MVTTEQKTSEKRTSAVFVDVVAPLPPSMRVPEKTEMPPEGPSKPP